MTTRMANEQADLLALRRELPGANSVIYLNSAGSGPLPLRAYRTIRNAYERTLIAGAIVPETVAALKTAAEDGRRQLAATLHAREDELAFFRSVALALGTVLSTMDWREGDEVIVTSEENPAFLLPFVALAERRGIKLRFVDVQPDDALLAEIEGMMSERTRVIAISHVTHVSGSVLPVAALAKLASKRGAVCIIDGAQAVGQIAVDVKAIGADWYLGIGHKWLFGPDGTAFLVWNRNKRPNARPLLLGVGAIKRADYDAGRIDWRDDARRFEFGGNPWPLYAALGEAAKLNAEAGIERIMARAGELQAYARDWLAEQIPGARVISPAEPHRMSAILGFQIKGHEGRTVIERLSAEGRIVAQWRRMRLDQDGTSIRLSLAWFLREDEISTCIAAISRIVKDG